MTPAAFPPAAALAAGLALGLAAAPGRAAAPPVVADWTFDDGPPGQPVGFVFDQSGRGHHGAQVLGAPRHGTDACGRGSSLVLPPGQPFGFGSGFLAADAAAFEFAGGAFTIEAVFEAGRDGFGFWRTIVGRDAGPARPGLVPWALSFQETTREVAFGIIGEDLAATAVTAPWPEDGGRHHVAGVYSNLVLRLYVDGRLVAATNAPVPPAAGPMAGVSVGANTLGGFWLAGVLDRVRVTAAALAPEAFFDPCAAVPSVRLEPAPGDPLAPYTRGFAGAWGDFDGDGAPDLFVANHDGGGALLRNDGRGGLAPVEPAVMTPPAGVVTAAAWADYDLDGDLDLVVTRAAGGPNEAYRNEGGRLVSAQRFSRDRDLQTITAAWADVNRDGRPDLLFSNGGGAAAIPNQLYLNRGEDSFHDVSGGPLNPGVGYSHGAAWADLDGNGWPDLVVANAFGPNFTFFNQGGTNFTAPPADSVLHDFTAPGTAAVALGDFNDDGWPDIFLSNGGAPNRLLAGTSGGAFVRTPWAGEAGESIGAVWADFDNDGDLDLFVCNRGGRNFYYEGAVVDGVRGLRRSSLGAPTLEASAANGAAVADVNGDGFLDLAVFQWQGRPSRLFLNTTNANAWLRVRAAGPSAPDGTGVKLRLEAGGAVRHRWISAGDALGSTELVAHFGLGAATNVGRLTVTWPSGAELVLTNVAPRQVLAVAEPDFGAPGEVTLNRQTGLFEQRVRFVQLRGDATNAVRVRVTGLPEDVRLHGGERVAPDAWELLMRGPLARFVAGEFTVEFHRPGRRPFAPPAYAVAGVEARPPDDAPAGAAPVPVGRVLALDGGRFLIEFAAVPGARYVVQYADELGAWRTASGAVTAGATRVQWLDTGLPKTTPAAGPGRFYRVFQVLP
jgi:hypothetical protein